MQGNIILTGATGFLGSHILRSLLEKTQYNVIVLKRSFSDVFRINDMVTNTRIKFVDIDKHSLEESSFDKCIAIIHVATDYGRQGGSCANVLETNLIYPVRLLELAYKYKVGLFINTDSYFNKDGLSYLYLQNYSLSKKSLNLWLKYFSKKIKIINFVLEHIYGDNDNPQKFVPTIIDKIAVKKLESVNVTNGDQKRDFIFVDDVADAYLAALNYGLRSNFRYRQFDVGTGQAISIKEFLTTVKRISKSDTVINFGAIPYRDDEIMLSEADNIDLLELGWRPKFTVEEGIKEIMRREQNVLADNCHTNI